MVRGPGYMGKSMFLTALMAVVCNYVKTR